MLACSYCVSVNSPEWWTTAALGRGLVAVVLGLVMVVVALRSVGRRRLGAALTALGLLVALPAAAFLGGTTTEIEAVTSRPPSDAPAWRVSCTTVFGSSAGADPWGGELEQACHEGTVVRRAATFGVATLGAVAVMVGGALLTFGGRRRQREPVPV